MYHKTIFEIFKKIKNMRITETAFLVLRFKQETEYRRALDFFASDYSSFTINHNNDEFHSLHFEVSHQDDADNTERYMTKELIENSFESFWFESENL